MATDLLCPPLEVLRGIYGLLLYPELTKLRMTCRQLRQIGADDIVRSALLQLEDDWAEAALKEQEHYTAGINVSPSILLRAWGYDNERERAEFEQHLLPCYGCLEIRHSDSFLPSQTLCEVTINAVAFANLNQQRPNAVATRKCLWLFFRNSTISYTTRRPLGSCQYTRCRTILDGNLPIVRGPRRKRRRATCKTTSR